MTGKFTTMHPWAMCNDGPSYVMFAPIRQRPDDLSATSASVAILVSPRTTAALDVQARYGLSKESMACGLGHG